MKGGTLLIPAIYWLGLGLAREIEEFILRHPAVADVQVVSVPDVCFGEEVCACALVNPGVSLSQEDLRAFCQGQIAHYKIPRYVSFPEELPMTVTGKVQKYRLREWAAAQLADEAAAVSVQRA